MREKLGENPFEVKKEGNKTTFRFFPKGENAKNPNSIVFVLSLDSDDKTKLEKILS